MIREVVPGAVALVVFSLAGALYALVTLFLSSYSTKGFLRSLSFFFLGLLGGLFFIAVSEIFYAGVVTPYTAFSFAVGFVFALVLQDEPANKKHTILLRKKVSLNHPKSRLKRKNKTPKNKAVTSG